MPNNLNLLSDIKKKKTPRSYNFLTPCNIQQHPQLSVIRDTRACVYKLEKTCKELVAHFDGSLIESARQFAQQYFETTTPPLADPASQANNQLAGFTVTEVQEEPKPRNLRIDEPTSSPAAPVFFTVVGVQEINVRSGPGMNYPTIAKLRNGTSGIQVLGNPVMNEKTEWVRVHFGELQGWMCNKYLHAD